MTNDQLYNRAVEAIKELFNDRSVSIAVCRENLEGLEAEIDMLIESLGVPDESETVPTE